MGKRKKSLNEDASPEEQVDFLIQEANRNLENGNYGSAEFKAAESISVAKAKLGLDHPLTGRADICAATIFISSSKIGKARGLLDQALEIGDKCEDHSLKAAAYGGLAEVAMRDPQGKKNERAKLSNEYWRLKQEEEERAVKFPAKPPPPVEPAPGDDEEVYGGGEDDYYHHSKSAKKSGKHRPRTGRDKEWDLLKERKETSREEAEKIREIEEEAAGMRPSGDLSTYSEMEGGWKCSPDSKWLYHEGSNVFLRQSSGKYYRKGPNGDYIEVKPAAQHEDSSAAKEETPSEFTGVVKTVIQHKGYGFIKVDGGLNDVWVKLGSQTLVEGMEVRFKMGRYDGRDCAVDIVITSEPKKAAPAPEPKKVVVEEDGPLVLFDIWGRPVKQVEEAVVKEKEESPVWDKEVKMGVELLRGHQLVMEDYHAREQLGSLGTMFAVFDGHGGREASEFCSNKFGTYLELEFRKKFPLDLLRSKKVNPFQPLPVTPCPAQAGSGYLTDIITNGFLAADNAFLEASAPQEGKEPIRAGSTGVVCFLRGPSKDKLQLITANVGDSRAVLCRAGKAVRLSEDHKPSRKDERARIEEAGGSVLEIGGSWRCTAGRDWGETRFKMPEQQLLLATSRAIGDREADPEQQTATPTVAMLAWLETDLS